MCCSDVTQFTKGPCFLGSFFVKCKFYFQVSVKNDQGMTRLAPSRLDRHMHRQEVAYSNMLLRMPEI